jgi:hypothetical protein
MMSENIDLKAIEKKIYLTYHEDGLMDLFMGITFLLVGIGKYFGETSFITILPVIILLIARKMKRIVTFPRIGYVDFGSRATGKRRMYLLLMMCVPIILGVIIYFVSNRISVSTSAPNFMDEYGSLIYPSLMGIMLVIISFILEAKRMISYALLFVLAFVIAFFTDVNKAYSFMAIGLIVTVSGAFVLNRFVKKYPKQAIGGNNE